MNLEFASAYSKEIFALVSVLLTFSLNRFFRLKAKILYSVRHSSNYIVEEPLRDPEGNIILHHQMVRTASIVSENNGLSPAKNVEFTFNWKPPIFNVHPGRAFSTGETGMGRWTLKLDSLAPGEVFAIEILSINQDLPLISSVRSDDATGVLINMAPQRVWPAWFNRPALFLFLMGMAATVYLIIAAIQWAIW